MSLSPEHRAKLIADTRDQAVALLDDLNYLREICAATALSAPTLRRTSSILRRLLVESDINQIACSRLGRVLFLMPDNKSFYDEASASPFMYFASGGIILGQRYRLLPEWEVIQH
jgi:hypothetical protein